MKASSSRTLDMTTGSPLRLLLAFALPIFLGNLLQQFYNLADTALAGHILGDAALAQIGATAALYSLPYQPGHRHYQWIRPVNQPRFWMPG